ncbi:flagellar basal-body rod protein FlgC [Ferrimonas balearica DSM 9799]|uniref:Flagellar basal-body rod protein FlgC n=1 Tax=Ferrimonas balearica (strain DSM 9799 / CCM 4581 / KCTC 23876 / PAT) TaxID=550540 RepID=E1SQU1_FERBD|nr:flagellar basal body rod protein FlgC [Ferrimonas balearica]ADN76866.1 flagellar basal-body rod protein FlgC [Ferrimonas balearica DSM 9799]
MSLFKIFDTAGSGMSAQSVRLNTTASNIANANSVSSSAGETYRARQPIFEAALQQASGYQNQSVPVQVAGIVESDKPLVRQFSPNHPLADQEGYIYKPNVNVVEEMANMISASRSYQANVQVASAAKDMAQQTLRLGKG